MRMGTTVGCFELDDVISIAAEPGSAAAARLYVQDSGGGNYSAMQIGCDASTHPCAANYSAITVGRDLMVTGTYAKSSAGLETFAIDSITNKSSGAVPSAATTTLASIESNSTSLALVFQKVTVSVAAVDALRIYDFTPAQFVVTGASACPYQTGFGMLPTSATGGIPSGACTSGTAQPVGAANPSASEVLIDTRFTPTYDVSSDCRCASSASDKEPTTTSTLSGSVSGILLFGVHGATGFIAIAPTTTSDAPLTNTVNGM